MRYYDIQITDPTGAQVIREYTSLNADGTPNPGALNVEIDAPVTTFATPGGDTGGGGNDSGAAVRVWGVSLTDLSSATDLYNNLITVKAGFTSGLPLEQPTQAGLILQGRINQPYGNWIGVNLTLDMIVTAGAGSPSAPKNLVLNWPAGMDLGTAIGNTLKTAFPTFPAPKIDVNKNLVLNYPVWDYKDSMTQFGQYVNDISKKIVGGSYTGVHITLHDRVFEVYDDTATPNTVAIAYTDLIGQPTWISAGTIQVTVMMRGDLDVGYYFTLPNTLVTSTPQTQAQFRDATTFTGKFQIASLRHVGNFRQADATSWVTVITGYPAGA